MRTEEKLTGHMPRCSRGGGVRLTGEGAVQVSSLTELTREDTALRLYLEGGACCFFHLFCFCVLWGLIFICRLKRRGIKLFFIWEKMYSVYILM